MPTTFTYPLSSSTPASPAPAASTATSASPVTRASAIGRRPALGRGILAPFVRDQKNDFANASDEENVRACVMQVLGTECSTDGGEIGGELPWRPEFGSLWYLVRHRGNDESLLEVARVYVTRALQRWEPRVRLTGVRVVRSKSDPARVAGYDTITAFLDYDIVTTSRAGNQVVISGVSQEVRLR